MIRLLRRSRLLALAFVLATPALGGAWLQALHPCPVDTPWLMEAEHAGEHGEDHHGSPAGHAEGCHCIGSCSAAGVAGVPTASLALAVVVPTPPPASVFPPRVDAAPLRPSDRLPPATAPPLV